MQPLLNVKEIATILGIGKEAVRSLINRGELESVNVAVTGMKRQPRVTQQALEKFIERRKMQKPAPSVRRIKPKQEWV